MKEWRRYRVDYGPLVTDDVARNVARYLPASFCGLSFRPSFHWRRRPAVRAAQLDGHPMTRVTDRWTGAAVPPEVTA